MILALFAAGIISFITGIIIGIMIGSFWGIVFSIIGGFVTSCLFFGIANVLQNQEIIVEKLQSLADFNRKNMEKQVCSKCDKKYDKDLYSCPHCGVRSRTGQ